MRAEAPRRHQLWNKLPTKYQKYDPAPLLPRRLISPATWRTLAILARPVRCARSYGIGQVTGATGRVGPSPRPRGPGGSPNIRPRPGRRRLGSLHPLLLPRGKRPTRHRSCSRRPAGRRYCPFEETRDGWREPTATLPGRVPRAARPQVALYVVLIHFRAEPPAEGASGQGLGRAPEGGGSGPLFFS